MRRNKGIAGLVALSVLFPTPGGLYAAHSPAYRIGVSRGDSEGGVAGEQAYARLERNLTRFLENDRSLGVRAESLGNLDSALATYRHQVWTLENDAMTLAAASAPNLPLSQRIDRQVAELEGFPELSPLFQRARVAQAIHDFQWGQSALARRFLNAALMLHPEGSLEQGGQGLPKGALREAAESISRGCSVSLEVFPARASIQVDGFEFGGKRQFQLLRGRAYQAWIQAEGFGSREVLLDCRRAGQWLETVRLTPGVREPERLVERLRVLTRQKDVASLLFTRTVSPGRFGLYLYTPGVGVDSVPLESPLAFGGPGHEAAEGPFPIASDALSELLDRHRAAPLRVSLAQAGENGYVFPRQTTAATVERPRWYENKVLWIVAGATLAGVTAGLLLNSHARDVHTNAVTARVQ